MDLGQILSWVVGAIGLTGFYFSGKKVWWSWYINLACQILWVAYALATGQPAFLVTAAVYSVIFAVNAYKWTKDRHAVKIGYVEDSNLVRHARTELERYGEDQDIVEWFVRVIREYASFGHSGGSHFAIMPTLTRLLNFEPLTDLTNDPDEWMRINADIAGEERLWQNRRDGRAFSHDGGETYTLTSDPRDPEGNKRVYTSACNICWANRYNEGNYTCPGCGASTGNYVLDPDANVQTN